MKLNAKFLTAAVLAASVLTLSGVSPANAGFWGKVRSAARQADPFNHDSTAARWGRNFDHGTLPYRREAGWRALRYGDDSVRIRTGVPYLPDPQAR